MKLFMAPLQGYTDAPYRLFHTEVFGGADGCFSPFLRWEKGEPARRTMPDILSPLNAETAGFVPQIIFRDAEEMRRLAGALKAEGVDRVDLNMGCPFPPQVAKGRGAGFLLRREEMEKVAAYVAEDSSVSYSLKMRLGVDDPWQWRDVVSVLRKMPLEHVTIHPRTAREQYRGDLHLDRFEELASAVGKPVVFNGEIHTPGELEEVAGRWPWLHGVMAGRGLLGRPSLFREWRDGQEWDDRRRLEGMLRLHGLLWGYYRGVLCGEAQLLARMKSFWDYALLPHRQLKRIAKARSEVDYEAAVRELSV